MTTDQQAIPVIGRITVSEHPLVVAPNPSEKKLQN